jgi:hypothetical protein
MMLRLVAKLGSIEKLLKRTPARTDQADHSIAQSRKDVEQGTIARAADVGGVTAKAANKTRTETNQDATNVNQDATNVKQEAVSEAQIGTRKRRRLAEVKASADAPAPPSAADSGAWSSDPGPMKRGKPGTRHRRIGTAETDVG